MTMQSERLAKLIDVYVRDDWKSAALKMIKVKNEIDSEINSIKKTNVDYFSLFFEILIRVMMQVAALVIAKNAIYH